MATLTSLHIIHELADGYNTIGRTLKGNNIEFPWHEVSREHCVIVKTSNGWRIKDRFSTNGTRLNGVKVEPGKFVPLTHGDKVRIGGVEFTFEE